MTPLTTNRAADPGIAAVRRRCYRELTLGQVPRILSAADRNPHSPTYGCLDRAFWHYRTMTDYAAPIHQEGVLSLVMTRQQEDGENPYFGSDDLLAVAAAGLRYWCRMQRPDGSFDEFYPWERSFVATAFTSYAVSESAWRLGEELGVEVRGEVVDALRKACDWLDRHRDVVVVNHTAGAIAAMYNAFLLTQDRSLLGQRERKIEDLLAHQHEEGWFYEYGGADPAYLSLAIDYLAKDFRHSRDVRLGRCIDKALTFMVNFMHPDGSYGGEYGSRNAKYLMPHALELLARETPEAAYLLGAHHRGLAAGNIVAPAVMDDRYGAFFTNKYAEAWAACDHDLGHVPEEFERGGTRHFPGAGLLVRRDAESCAVVGISKHGVLKAFSVGDGARLLFSDAGYFARFDRGRMGTSQWLDRGVDATVESRPDAGTRISLSCQMKESDTSLPMRQYLVPFRLFLKLFGRSGFLMDLFSRRVKQRMIGVRRSLPLRLDRVIAIETKALKITDRIQHAGGVRLETLGRCRDAAALHVASSRYHQRGELDVAGAWQVSKEEIDSLNAGCTLQVETKVALGVVPDQALVRVETKLL